MKLGFSTMNNPDEMAPHLLGPLLEQAGFDSLWMGEHSHIPVARTTPYPAGGELPERYKAMMDPFLSLLVAARATSDLLLGTGVALPLEHDIFDLAKTAATLDVLSGGRLLFGVGVGWNVEELANVRSTPWKQRYGALAESVAALRVLWTEEESELHGRHYNFDPVWSFPKPLQQPHPPILCGMSGRLGTEHAIAWADGWMPIDAGLGNLERVAKKVGLFREAEKSAGREPMAITFATMSDPGYDTLARYRDLGIERTVVGIGTELWDDPSATPAFVERYARRLRDLA
jgi:probable F420-dependent oxidoreductase